MYHILTNILPTIPSNISEEYKLVTICNKIELKKGSGQTRGSLIPFPSSAKAKQNSKVYYFQLHQQAIEYFFLRQGNYAITNEDGCIWSCIQSLVSGRQMRRLDSFWRELHGCFTIMFHNSRAYIINVNFNSSESSRSPQNNKELY